MRVWCVCACACVGASDQCGGRSGLHGVWEVACVGIRADSSRPLSTECTAVTCVLCVYRMGEQEAALAIPDLSVLYLSGNQLIMAPSVPNFETTESLYAALGGTPWREIISWIAAPALLLVPLMALTVRDPKKRTTAAAAAAAAAAPPKKEEESKPNAAVGVFGEFKDVWCVRVPTSVSREPPESLACPTEDGGGRRRRAPFAIFTRFVRARRWPDRA